MTETEIMRAAGMEPNATQAAWFKGDGVFTARREGRTTAVCAVALARAAEGKTVAIVAPSQQWATLVVKPALGKLATRAGLKEVAATIKLLPWSRDMVDGRRFDVRLDDDK